MTFLARLLDQQQKRLYSFGFLTNLYSIYFVKAIRRVPPVQNLEPYLFEILGPLIAAENPAQDMLSALV
jgi:hypothetical protein